jgi:hypothetical protein
MYKSGLVNITVNKSEVVGQGTNFSTYVTVGDLFKLTNEAVWYQVGAVNSATNLTLSSVYANSQYSASTALNGMQYQIVRDYTPHKEFPEMGINDANLAYIFTKAIRMVDESFYKDNVKHIATNYTATTTDKVIVVSNNPDPALTVTVPQATAGSKGRIIRIINNTASDVVATANATPDLINDAVSTLLTTRYQTLDIQVATANLWIKI